MRVFRFFMAFLTISSFLAIVCLSQKDGTVTVSQSVTQPGGTSQAGGITLQGVFGQPLVSTAQGGQIRIDGGFLVPQFGPTSASVSVSGRVVAPGGFNGVRNAFVTITDMSGYSRRIGTGSFGYFRFEEIPAGRTYLISVQSRQFNYAEQVINVTDNLSDLLFIGQTQP